MFRNKSSTHAQFVLALFVMVAIAFGTAGFTAPGCGGPKAANTNSGGSNAGANKKTVKRQVLEGLYDAEVGVKTALNVTEDLSQSKKISRETERSLLKQIRQVNRGVRRLNQIAGTIDPDKVTAALRGDLLSAVSTARDGIRGANDLGFTDLVSGKYGTSIRAALEAVDKILQAAEQVIQTLKVASTNPKERQVAWTRNG
jgi:hypothetical protein